MTITMPWQGTGNRRAVDEVVRLRHQLAGAGILIQGLRLQITDAETARDRANEKANRLSEADTLRERAEQAMADLKDELLELRAFKARTLAITVPPMHRDIDPGDQATEPTGIDVRPLWEALRPHGPVTPVPVTSPARLPSRAVPADDDTVQFVVLADQLVQRRAS